MPTDYKAIIEKAWKEATEEHSDVMENYFQNLVASYTAVVVDWKAVAIAADLVPAEIRLVSAKGLMSGDPTDSSPSVMQSAYVKLVFGVFASGEAHGETRTLIMSAADLLNLLKQHAPTEAWQTQ